MAIFIAPNCPPEVERMIRKEHAGETIYGRSLVPLNRRGTDERTIAERKWREGNHPKMPQSPCDLGLFRDEGNQLKLI